MSASSQPWPGARVRSLMVGYPKVIRENRLIAMLKCFFDDSGSDPQPDGVFVLAGYLMPSPWWEGFAQKWYAQLQRDYRIDYCRMADAHSGDGEFAGMDSVFRQRKVKDIALVVRECSPLAISARMTWRDYRVAVADRVPGILANPYAVLFFDLIGGVSHLQATVYQLTQSRYPPIEFVFDVQNEAEAKCAEWYRELRQMVPEPHRSIIANTPSFKDDKDLMPLQAADMLAWHLHRKACFPDEDRSEILDMLNPAGIWSHEVMLQDLQVIANAFNQD